LYGTYIDKEKGIIEAGLSKGTKVRLQVESMESRRLFLDFTNDVLADAETERRQQEERTDSSNNDESHGPIGGAKDDRELDEWATYANEMASASIQNNNNNNIEIDDDDNDDDDDEDEDSQIEEALGLDMY
jgi:hypothetical protein